MCAIACPAQAAPFVYDSESRRLTSPSGLCVDISGGGGAGTHAIVYPCHGGDNQAWTYDALAHVLRSEEDTCQLCLGVCYDTDSLVRDGHQSLLARTRRAAAAKRGRRRAIKA